MGKSTKEKIDESLKESTIELSKTKDGCAFMFKSDFDNLINWSEFAKKFDRTNAWLAKKFHGCVFPMKDKPFTEEEYQKLASILREMADSLNRYADLIDKAENDVKL